MPIPTVTPTDRRFGVEIEFVGATKTAVFDALMAVGIPTQIQDYNHSTTNLWKIVDDGSVVDENGIGTGELVSPILSGSEGLATLVKALNALNSIGAHANNTCGLHVHVDARGLNFPEISGIYLTYAANENHFDSIMPRSRRSNNNTYCRTITRSEHAYNDTFFNRLAVTNARQLIENLNYERYFKVNLSSLTRHGTIEFRHHSGTTNPEKVCNWVVFLLSFVQHCSRKVLEVGPDTGTISQPGTAVPHFTKSARHIFKILNRSFCTLAELQTFLASEYGTRIQPATIKTHINLLRDYGARSGTFRVLTRGFYSRKLFRIEATNGAILNELPTETIPNSYSNALRSCLQPMSFEQLFGIAGQESIQFYQNRLAEHERYFAGRADRRAARRREQEARQQAERERIELQERRRRERQEAVRRERTSTNESFVASERRRMNEMRENSRSRTQDFYARPNPWRDDPYDDSSIYIDTINRNVTRPVFQEPFVTRPTFSGPTYTIARVNAPSTSNDRNYSEVPTSAQNRDITHTCAQAPRNPDMVQFENSPRWSAPIYVEPSEWDDEY